MHLFIIKIPIRLYFRFDIEHYFAFSSLHKSMLFNVIWVATNPSMRMNEVSIHLIFSILHSLTQRYKILSTVCQFPNYLFPWVWLGIQNTQTCFILNKSLEVLFVRWICDSVENHQSKTQMRISTTKASKIQLYKIPNYLPNIFSSLSSIVFSCIYLVVNSDNSSRGSNAISECY